MLEYAYKMKHAGGDERVEGVGLGDWGGCYILVLPCESIYGRPEGPEQV